MILTSETKQMIRELRLVDKKNLVHLIRSAVRDYVAFQKIITDTKVFLESIDLATKNKLRKISLRIYKLRQQLFKIFEGEKLVKICSDCKGRCCVGQFYSMSKRQIVAFLSMPTSIAQFKICAPPFEWHIRRIIDGKPEHPGHIFKMNLPYIKDHWTSCLYKGENGCLLEKWRPFLCLKTFCPKLEQKTSEESLKKAVELADAIKKELEKITALTGI